MKKPDQNTGKPVGDMTDKFKRVMDWGTPRLVTRSRGINIDPSKMEARNMLLNLANARKGVIDLEPVEKKESFNQATVQNFRKKMMEEELQSSQYEMKKQESIKDPLNENMNFRKSSIANNVLSDV